MIYLFWENGLLGSLITSCAINQSDQITHTRVPRSRNPRPANRETGLDRPFRNAPTHLVVVLRHEEDGDEGHPDDAGRVHGEADVLGLVEVLGGLAGLDGVPRAEEDEEHVVAEAEGQGEVGDAAGEDGDLAARVDDLDAGRLDEEPHDHADHLDGHEAWKKLRNLGRTGHFRGLLGDEVSAGNCF